MEEYALQAVERLTTRPAEPYDTLSVDPITPLLGAEVSGLDLTRELTPVAHAVPCARSGPAGRTGGSRAVPTLGGR